ncbi:kinase-like protein, partial [Bimuria novae-zelandiae CBS 107.79]
EETDSTPRSEVPSVLEAVSETLRQHSSSQDAEPSYFSPQPLRVLPSQIPHSEPSHEPSPTGSGSAFDPPRSSSLASASSWRATGPSPVPPAESDRPPYQRDLSSTSTATVATVRADSVDTAHVYLPPRQRDGPIYPNQSYAALQMQQHMTNTPNILRAKSSQPAHHSGYSLSHITGFGSPAEYQRDLMETGSRTVGNSPASSPGLFGTNEPQLRHTQPSNDNLYSGPWLHHTHRQAPKETHRADVDVDPMSGRKIINHYEILDELGRGMHGKVKLGRDLENGATVAIKIIDRYSKRRRLGKNTSHEDKIKREIAILKKARHDNIVGLLEVIDDPSKKKVYIILEHITMGEVKWRKEGAKEICLVEWRRIERESRGIFDNESAKMEDDAIIKLAHQKLQRQQRRQARKRRLRRMQESGNDAWSLELGGDSEDDYSDNDGERPSSRLEYTHRQGSSTSQDVNMETAFRAGIPLSNAREEDHDLITGLEGTMYGPYDTEAFRGRTPSIAGSSSSHFTNGEDEIPEHFLYVPVLTFEKARNAFRDTVLGLEYLHYQNVIHRDIKPANLLVTARGNVKISDFGVSYLGSGPPREDSVGDQSESDAPDVDEAIELAKTVGTPAFYAPELCQTELDAEPYKIDKAIDIWALGVTLYCLIYGRVPFHDQNQFFLMKRITDDEPYIPRYRLKPVEDSPSSRPNSHGRMHMSSGDKRADHDLDYEAVDDALRDLLHKLLIKDPRKRITIPEIKRHPWFVQGLDNADKWVEETDKTLEGTKIEISKEDIDKAVIPFGALREVMRSTVGKLKDLTRSLTGRGERRRPRAGSNLSGQDAPPSISAKSSSSTISQDGRRPSLGPVNSLYEALSKSREPDHPLSHSVTASPATSDRVRYFEGSNSRTASPIVSTNNRELPSPAIMGGRPPLPDRAYSTLSSAASIRTVRPMDRSDRGYLFSPELPPALPGTPTALETPGGSNLSGIYGGVPKRAVHDARSERRRLKPPHEVSRAKSIDRLFGSNDDPHGEPSLAVSTAFAAGHVDQDLLKELSPSILGSSPQRSGTYSSSHNERGPSRQSSLSSVSSRLRKTWAANNETEAGPSLELPSIAVPQLSARDTSDDRFSRAKDEFVRQRLREAELDRQRSDSTYHQRPPSALSQSECPPSPDDETFYERHRKVEDFLDQQQRQPQYAASPVFRPVITETQSRPIVSSSSEERFTCMSQSTSNPSVPSVASATSSLALDDYAPQKMMSAGSGSSIYLNQFSTPTDDPAGYDGDHAVESEDDDSEEEFLVMGKKKMKPAPKNARSESITNAELARSNIRKELGCRRRTNRSGSNGTVKKVPPP